MFKQEQDSLSRSHQETPHSAVTSQTLHAQSSKCSRTSLLPAEMQKTSNSWVICSSLVTRKEPRHLPWTGLLGPHEANPSSQRTHVCSEVPENAMCITGTTTPACIRKQKKKGGRKRVCLGSSLLSCSRWHAARVGKEERDLCTVTKGCLLFLVCFFPTSFPTLLLSNGERNMRERCW